MAAVAFAAQVIVLPLRVPDAVPATFKSPAQFALNEPFADVGVCSVGFHLKSAHVDAAGMTLADAEDQLPINAATVELGPVAVVDDLLEYPTQPDTAMAKQTMVAKA